MLHVSEMVKKNEIYNFLPREGGGGGARQGMHIKWSEMFIVHYSASVWQHLPIGRGGSLQEGTPNV